MKALIKWCDIEQVEGKMEVVEVNHEKKKIKFKTTLRKVQLDKVAI